MCKLIIAEKPSLAKKYREALAETGEVFKISEDREFYRSENYYVTAQFGHLLELKMPGEYDEDLEKWELEPLPFFPPKYEYKLKDDEGVVKRYKTIKKLCEKDDVKEIMHAGDPDTEGQILVDLVLKQIGTEKPISRVWAKALDPESINKAIKNRKLNDEYVLLQNEGLARSYFDWDFGINLSRFVTLKASAKPAFNVGRVKGAILSELYDREVAIRDFVPETYYKVVSDVDGIKLTSKEKFDKDSEDKAVDYANTLQAGETKVVDITTKPSKKKRPKLFSQTRLQGYMNKKYGYDAQKTLNLCQSLYEKGVTSYPRTSSEYLLNAECGEIDAIIRKIDKKGQLEIRLDKTVFDDSKVDGHSALIITGVNPKGESLNEEEMNCYMAILNRFRAVFCKEECIYDKTVAVLENPAEEFKLSGEVLKQEGWQKFEPPRKNKDSETSDNDKDNAGNVLPPIKVGDIIKTDFRSVEAKTTAPSRYTEDSLGKWMENPFSKDDADDEEYYKNVLAGSNIGTDATRAGTLEELKKKEYIELKKTSYYVLERGMKLVEACRFLNIDFSKEMTAGMNKSLKDISKGEIEAVKLIQEERKEIERIISGGKEIELPDEFKIEEMIYGDCPKCGNPIKKIKAKSGKTYYVCSAGKEACGFILNPVQYGKKLTDRQLRQLILFGSTNVISGFVSKNKNGKKYSGWLKMSSDGTVKMMFD